MNQPQPPPAYDLNPLLTRFASTYRRLDTLINEPKRRKRRKTFDDIGEELCKFFTDLIDDEQFWKWLGTLPDPTPEQVKAFLDSIDGFEDRQKEILDNLGVDKLVAGQLVTRLQASIEQYRELLASPQRPRVAQAAADFNTYVGTVRGSVCADPTLENVSNALDALTVVGGVATGLAAATGALAAGTAAAFAAPVVIGFLGLGAIAARIIRRNKGQ